MHSHAYEVVITLPRKAGGDPITKSVQTLGRQRAEDWKYALARHFKTSERAVTITRLTTTKQRGTHR